MSKTAIEIPEVVLAEMMLAATAVRYADAVTTNREVQVRREQLALAAIEFGRQSERVRRALLVLEGKAKP